MAEKFDTKLIHAGYSSDSNQHSVAVPVYATASYEIVTPERGDRLRSGAELGDLYSRLSNPTNSVLEARVASLDGGVGAVAVASGMAAISGTIIAVTGGSGRILSTYEIYGGAFDLENDIFPQLGIEFDRVKHTADLDEWEANVKEDTKAIYVESISNPKARLLDIDGLAKIAHKHGIPLIVDNTVATPYLYRPLEHGADIVIYSATKGLNGHGNTIGGLVVEGKPLNWTAEKYPQFFKKHWVTRDLNNVERSYIEAFPEFPFTVYFRTKILAYLGATLSPYNTQLILVGLETLSLRLDRTIANTRSILKYLEERKTGVKWVSYPEAEGSEYAALAKRDFPKGAGGILSFGFDGDEEKINKFLNAVKVFNLQANLGDAKSLIIHCPKITHGEMKPEELDQADISQNTIRLSLGIEDPDDLIEDLEQAFKAAGY